MFHADQAQSYDASSHLAHVLVAAEMYNQVHGKHQDIAWTSGQACFHADTMKHSVMLPDSRPKS